MQSTDEARKGGGPSTSAATNWAPASGRGGGGGRPLDVSRPERGAVGGTARAGEEVRVRVHADREAHAVGHREAAGPDPITRPDFHDDAVRRLENLGQGHRPSRAL